MAKTEVKTASKSTGTSGARYAKAPVRLWVKAKFLGFRRSREVQRPGQALLRLEGVNDSDAARFYFGKRVCYIYRAAVAAHGSKFRAIWGRIARARQERCGAGEVPAEPARAGDGRDGARHAVPQPDALNKQLCDT